MSLPTDPYFRFQWYIHNTGQGARTSGIDLNLIDEDPNNFDVWDDYSGSGVTVGVVDDGIPNDHPDLLANVNLTIPQFPDYDYSRLGRPVIWEDNHGTAVAGIIAAARNGVGTVGVAYNAKVTSFNAISLASSLTTAAALRYQSAFDVSNNSWGASIAFADNPRYFKTNRQDLDAIRNAATAGRNGLGTVLVFAAGNKFNEGVDADLCAISSSRFGITVAAVNGQGQAADYSSVGVSLLVSGFAEGQEPTRGQDGFNIATTDRVGDLGDNPSRSDEVLTDDTSYTGIFNGTSATAPQVSGVVALMLEANPSLGYRDVQEILAYSAVQNFPEQQDWQFNGAKNWNGGGLHVNGNYGYGIVDAHAAVRLAETWQLQSTAANEASLSASREFKGEGIAIPDRRDRLRQINLPVAEGLLVNQAELDIRIRHTAIEDLAVALVSPSGTRSLVFAGAQLTKPQAKIEVGNRLVSFSKLRSQPELAREAGDRDLFRLAKFYQKGLNYKFTTTFNWGEMSGGTWKVEVFDGGKRGRGAVVAARVNLYGDPATADDTYIYTEEFARFTGSETVSRRLLSDGNGGSDTVNAAALRSDVVLNLAPGQVSTLMGNSLQIADGTLIENAVTGDGRDTLQGNAANNDLRGGRNNDLLMGEAGSDTLLGGKQADILVGCGADRGLNSIDRLTGGEGADLFSLGDATASFYIAATGTVEGLTDFAVITDFAQQADRLQLHGRADQYSVGVSPFANSDAAAIYLNRSTGRDLVAVLQGLTATELDLTAGYVNYVGTGI